MTPTPPHPSAYTGISDVGQDRVKDFRLDELYVLGRMISIYSGVPGWVDGLCEGEENEGDEESSQRYRQSTHLHTDQMKGYLN